MLQVDEVVKWDGPRIVCKMTVRADNLFYVPGRGLPAYVGFEIMAQTIAVQDGLMRREDGLPPQIGFLLGSRKYSITRDWIAAGEVLVADCTALLDEGELRSYQCTLTTETGEALANGKVNVFRPDNPDAFLKGTDTPA